MIRLSIGALVCALTLPATTSIGSGTTSDVSLIANMRAVKATTLAAPAGPPWISIEYPANPYDQTTKNAFLVVHAFHHGQPTDFPVTGTAEGLVGGERKSVSLEFQRTTRPGVFALTKQWPADGVWTLVVAVRQGPEDAVYAVVDLAPNGTVASVRVPTRSERGYTLPAKLAMSDVEAGLKARARGGE